MSDRINDMSAALVAALGKYGAVHDAGYGFTTLTLYHDDMPRIARRLLAAMDAEPTEAEVEEAWSVYLATCRAIDTMTSNPYVHEAMRQTHAMRAALTAFLESRKATS